MNHQATGTTREETGRAEKGSGLSVLRRRLRQLGLFSAASLLVLGAGVLHRLQAQQSMDKVEITTQHVGGNIYMLKGAGGNIGVSAGNDGLLMVDDQFAPLADKIRAALKELGKGELKYILNTHWHGDHTGGNVEFGPKIPILAQDNVRVRMSTPQKLRSTPASPSGALPVITYSHAVTVHFNGEDIKVIHFPHGHTDGDSIIFFTGSNVVHMGDDFFAGRFPFVDLSSGGGVEGLIRNIKKVLGQVPPDAVLIPGHGKVSKVKDLKDYLEMLETTAGLVKRRMEAGKSLDDIKKEGLPSRWDEWGSGFIKTEKWLETIYNSLQQTEDA